MDWKHIEAVNQTAGAFFDALTEFVAVSRKQADRGELAMPLLDALMNANITSDDRAKFDALLEKLSPKPANGEPEPKRSTFAPRPRTVPPNGSLVSVNEGQANKS